MTWKRPFRAWALPLVVSSTVVGLGAAAVLRRVRRRRKGDGSYVALGSSFAAGLGLGPRAPGSPRLSMRSLNGYPQQLARMAGLSLIDVSSSGATSLHVLRRRQYLLSPQIDAVSPGTELVTLTIGGNDVGYIGDLTMLAARRRSRAARLLVGLVWKGPRPVEARGFASLQANISETLREIARRAPRARIVVITYPNVLPPTGACAALGISDAEADLMRSVGDKLAEVTRSAAAVLGASVVDMARLSIGHDACAAEPWVNGSRPSSGAPFHPTLAGAEAVACQVMVELGKARRLEAQ